MVSFRYGVELVENAVRPFPINDKGLELVNALRQDCASKMSYISWVVKVENVPRIEGRYGLGISD